MLPVPDVVGLPLAEARLRLAAAGLSPAAEVPTAPPRRPPSAGTCRVVQQHNREAGVVLVTALFTPLRDAPASTSETDRD